MLITILIIVFIALGIAFVLAIFLLPAVLWTNRWAKGQAKRMLEAGRIDNNKDFDKVSDILAGMAGREAADLYTRLQDIKWGSSYSTNIQTNPSSIPIPTLTKEDIHEEINANRQRALKQYLKDYQDGIITGIEIMATTDSCPTCKVAAKAYPPEYVPILPIETCTHPKGCRCTYIPVLR